MQITDFGNMTSDRILIRIVGDHDIGLIEKEISLIRKMTSVEFGLRAFKVDDWNTSLSPWKAPAVFENEDFGDGAEETLGELKKVLDDPAKKYYLCGYSMAGLFALWADSRLDGISGVAAVSPSVWFPGFTDHMRNNTVRSRKVYLSIGDKEEMTRNKIMATVGDRIRDVKELIAAAGADCTLEVNPGGHFNEPDVRMAKAAAWLLTENE